MFHLPSGPGSSEIHDHQISILDTELDLLQRRLELTRLPLSLTNEQWAESNGVTVKRMRELVEFWRKEYDWKAEEKRMNDTLPQFKTSIEMEDFGALDIHFVHSTSSSDAIPLMILHGWPGSFDEVANVLPHLNKAGFHVVAPSLPGSCFSSSSHKPGFKIVHHANVMQTIMSRLGYTRYVVQGSDWGSLIARTMATEYPDSVKAIHLTMMMMTEPQFSQEPNYSAFDRTSISRYRSFFEDESAYWAVQATKPRTLGFSMHDSPVGLLAWITDKYFSWSPTFAWTSTEIITSTLLHYFAESGPIPGLQIYRENGTEALQQAKYVKCPTAFSAFRDDMEVVPKAWAETKANIVFWKEYERGGHFALVERPKAMVEDLDQFFHSVWKEG